MVQPHVPMLRAWLASRFSSATDVDDIMQESFVRVLRARERGDHLASPKAFLFATARNLALDHLRHRKVAREESLVEFHASDVLDESEGVAETLRAPKSFPF